MRYACQVWGQSKNQSLNQIRKSQNKALRLLNFKALHENQVYNHIWTQSKMFCVKLTFQKTQKYCFLNRMKYIEGIAS